MEEFDGNSLRFEGFEDGIDVFNLIVRANTAVTETIVRWNVASLLFTRKIELVLDRRFSAHAMVCQSLDHSFEESTWAGFPGRTIIEDHVTHHTSTAWGIR